MKALVLGCGPAGLFAALAASRAGYTVAIRSRKRPSQLFGAQYLHRPIPGLNQWKPDFKIMYSLRGDETAYAKKVYGDTPPDFVSPQKLIGEALAWDIRAAYQTAYEKFHDAIIDHENIGPEDIGELAVGYDVVISTIPAPAICYCNGDFLTRQAWAIGDAPERCISCPVLVEPNSVVCDGTPDVGWYRASNIQDFRTAEWPGGEKPPYDDVVSIQKVISTNCKCWSEPWMIKTGRYGAWSKKLLSHNAYWDVLEKLR